jgi:hypothetical protein
MKVALGGEEKAAAEEEPAGKRAEQEGGAAHEGEEAAVAEEVPEEALEHAPAFEPGRGSEEWIALAVGVALVIAALGVLSARRPLPSRDIRETVHARSSAPPRDRFGLVKRDLSKVEKSPG